MEASNLTHDLHAIDPEQYLDILYYCKNNQIDVSEKINTKVYETWYSNHLSCLSYLVGDLENSHSHDFYGCQNSISNEMGIEIMQCLISLGVDIHDKNYYDQTVFDNIKQEDVLTSRINNEKFKEAILNLLRCPSPSIFQTYSN